MSGPRHWALQLWACGTVELCSFGLETHVTTKSFHGHGWTPSMICKGNISGIAGNGGGGVEGDINDLYQIVNNDKTT